MRTAVVTGIGICAAIGDTLPVFTESLFGGVSGIQRIRHFDVSGHQTKTAAVLCADEQPLSTQEQVFERCRDYLDGAVRRALADSGISAGSRGRIGLFLGTFLGEVGALRADEKRVVRPGEIDLAAITAELAAELQLTGTRLSVFNACAAGSTAIALAADQIRAGRLDCVVAGGYEFLGDYVFAGMNAIKALTDEIMPFDPQRRGTMLGEAVGVLVVEAQDRALSRNARIYAEIAGSSLTNDAYHMLRPDPEGRGVERAMRAALADAGITAGAVDYINAHGTGTRLNDAAEAAAIRALIGRRTAEVPVCSIKPIVGHTLGASGAIGAIGTILSINNSFVPPILFSRESGVGEGFLFPFGRGREKKVDVALSNAFGFGGINSCLVIRRHRRAGDGPAVPPPTAASEEIELLLPTVDVTKGNLQKEIDRLTGSFAPLGAPGRSGGVRPADHQGFILQNPIFYKAPADLVFSDLLEYGPRGVSPQVFSYSFPGSMLAAIAMKNGITGYCCSVANGTGNGDLFAISQDVMRIKRIGGMSLVTMAGAAQTGMNASVKKLTGTTGGT